MVKFPEISTLDLLEELDNKNTKIVDVRSIDAYNGWKLDGEARGGHIKGAKSLPADWTRYHDWIGIVRSKLISPDNKIILYGYTPNQNSWVAEFFKKAKYKNIYYYNKFTEEWAADPKLPMERLERYRHLVPPEWVKTIVDGGIPPEHNGGRTVICHAQYMNHDAYVSGHIPGAIELDTLELEAPETWNRRSPEELASNLAKHGIDADTTVVLYGKYLFPDNSDQYPGGDAGHIGAIRCAAIMMYAGVKDVRVLNGSFQAWEEAGYEISTQQVVPEPVPEFGAEIPVHPELIVDVPEAKRMIEAEDAELVCVRSWPEYIGEESGYNYIEKKGRIPGAVFVNCGTDAYHMENYRNLDNTTREYHEIARILNDAGLTPDKHLAFYCGTGWRGSEAFYNAWLMGWPRVSVFDGGWFEWSNDPENPYETGLPKL